MGLLTRACGVTAIALAATASIAKANEGWWYLLSRQGCGLSRDEETFKSPATFILTLKSIGREYSVDDRRDSSGQIVASIVTDHTTGGTATFFRTYALCKETLDAIQSKQENEKNDLLNRYR
jgi:hypothetical protein